MDEHKNNAHNLEAALKELEDIRPDVAKAFLSNHELPDKNPFDKTKMVSDASLWSELQELIAHFKEHPKAPITSMKGRGTYEQYIPMTFEELMNESSKDVMNTLAKNTSKDFELGVYKYFKELSDEEQMLEMADALIGGLIAGLQPSVNSQFHRITFALQDAVTEIKNLRK